MCMCWWDSTLSWIHTLWKGISWELVQGSSWRSLISHIPYIFFSLTELYCLEALVSENGWSDDFLYKQWFHDIFIPHTKARNTSGTLILLIYDGHNSHLTDRMVKLVGKKTMLSSFSCCHTQLITHSYLMLVYSALYIGGGVKGLGRDWQGDTESWLH